MILVPKHVFFKKPFQFFLGVDVMQCWVNR
jgi:hypothetical protein